MIENINVIKDEGLRVLTRELGVANTAMFLRQFDSGSGDYTKERQSTSEENSIDSIVARIIKQKARHEK
ncbi:MAG: hypothetical protein FWE27_09030 [Defluviitaleaceae bacterium]|nr:hypothetical protein [Defluviitaleaceae bacterium]